MKLIGVGEFSDDADWKDPCISFILPEVICKQCNYCRDIDLCKDPNVAEDDVHGKPVWICASTECQTPYDTSEIEHQLIGKWITFFMHISPLHSGLRGQKTSVVIMA